MHLKADVVAPQFDADILKSDRALVNKKAGLKSQTHRGGGAVYYVINKKICVVCFRVADMPTPKVPSVQGRCTYCGTPVWVAKKSPVAPPKVCAHCMDLEDHMKSERRDRRGRRYQIH